MDPTLIEPLAGLVDIIGAPMALVVMYFFYQRKQAEIDTRRQEKHDVFTVRRDQEWAEVLRQIDDLHEWHAKEDKDGVKMWYVRQGLWDSLDKLVDQMADQTAMMSDLVTELRRGRNS